jgi:hypothetical protein
VNVFVFLLWIGFDSAWMSDSRERLCDFPSKMFRKREVCVSENQMFRILAGNLPGRGERLSDNSELYKIPEGGNFQTWLSERESVSARNILLIFIFVFIMIFFVCICISEKNVGE